MGVVKSVGVVDVTVCISVVFGPKCLFSLCHVFILILEEK